MSKRWQTASSVPPHIRMAVPTKVWTNMPPIDEWNPKTFVLGRPLRTKRHATALAETCPAKILKIAEGSFFYPPPHEYPHSYRQLDHQQQIKK